MKPLILGLLMTVALSQTVTASTMLTNTDRLVMSNEENTVQISPDNRILVIGARNGSTGEDSTLSIYDISNPDAPQALVKDLSFKHNLHLDFFRPNKVVFSADSNLFVIQDQSEILTFSVSNLRSLNKGANLSVNDRYIAGVGKQNRNSISVGIVDVLAVDSEGHLSFSKMNDYEAQKYNLETLHNNNLSVSGR